MPTGLTRKGAAARARIVAGAAEVLRTQGVSATGLEAVRAATGTSNSQLFHYFPGGKAQLMVAVAEFEAARILEQQRPLLGDFGDWSGVRSWADALVERLEAQGVHCALGALLSRLDPNDPDVRAVVVDMNETWERELADGLLRLRETGDLPAHLDPGAAAAAMLAGIQGGALMLLATGSGRHLRIAVDSALTALRNPPDDELRLVSGSGAGAGSS